MSTVPTRQESTLQPSNNSSTSNNAMGGNGDNSDNSGSGFISIGNNSFGFNFDSEDGASPSPVHSDAGTKSDEDGGSPKTKNININEPTKQQGHQQQQQQAQAIAAMQANGSGARAGPPQATSQALTHEAAAAAAVAQLQHIANQSISSNSSSQEILSGLHEKMSSAMKRKPSSDNGYKSDDEETLDQDPTPAHAHSNAGVNLDQDDDSVVSFQQPGSRKGKKPKIHEDKREERNAREKERSYRITSQINELRALLSTGGVIVPKGTKNAVLTEAANYIRALQQQQYKSEIHRQQLIQQMQMIGGGQLGSQAAHAIRHVAAQTGVWSLGNFGGVPPRSAMSSAQQEQEPNAVQSMSNTSSDHSISASTSTAAASTNDQLMKNIEDHDYRFVFNSCAVGMAIASMGGAFIDCNQLFINLSEYNKQEICGLTIFNLTARDDLQNAFDLISQMISPPAENDEFSPSCVLRGNMKTRADLGLNITLIKDEEGIAKCFCVSLIKTPASPFDSSTPIHATAEFIRTGEVQDLKAKQTNMSSPAFMAG
jgi:PAS domain-containing protein